LRRIPGIHCIVVLVTGAMTISAQSVGTVSQPPKVDCSKAGVICDYAADPVAQVKHDESWHLEPFVNYGNGFGNRDQYRFFWAGIEAGKILTPVVGKGWLSGQFEYAGNVMPLWQAYTPAPHEQLYTCIENGVAEPCELPFGGGTFYGVSITPVIFRWQFNTHARKVQPWFQAAGGLIYTTHKFPPNILSNPSLHIDGGTCVFNFSPQGGGGLHFFLRDKRSIDLGVNGVHISSASLGDRNPGVNASVQIQVGYTFWK
jgi:lipid A 3-O-deacylase